MEEIPGTLAGVHLCCEVELREPELSSFMPESMVEAHRAHLGLLPAMDLAEELLDAGGKSLRCCL